MRGPRLNKPRGLRRPKPANAICWWAAATVTGARLSYSAAQTFANFYTNTTIYLYLLLAPIFFSIRIIGPHHPILLPGKKLFKKAPSFSLETLYLVLMKSSIGLFTVGIALNFVFTGCSNKVERKIEKTINYIGGRSDAMTPGFRTDSLDFITQPGTVWLTGHPTIRLNSVFMMYPINEELHTGQDSRYGQYIDDDNYQVGNHWNGHLYPGFEAVYGFNMVNISHYDLTNNKHHLLFEQPVLIRTAYYPTDLKDSLLNQPVHRNHLLVTAHNSDTNKDTLINTQDLRRMFLFDINGQSIKTVLPENYNIFKSDYDQWNDHLLVYARLDQNNDGQSQITEPVHVFWVNLKDPTQAGRLY